MYGEILSTEIPDLKGFIDSLNKLDDKVNSAIVTEFHKGGKEIAEEQKRLLRSRPTTYKYGHALTLAKLSDYIKADSVETGKDGSVSVEIGYHRDAFYKTLPGGDNSSFGVVGLTLEFGRPGETRSDTMEQNRMGTVYKVKKGAIEPCSHIARGFDNKIAEVSEDIISGINSAIDSALEE